MSVPASHLSPLVCTGPVRGAVLVAIVLCGGLPGSGLAAVDLDRARQYWESRDLAATAIELKDILQRHPDDVPARLLMAEVQLALLQGGAAESELLRARAAGADDDALLGLLVPALLLQGEPQRALDALTLAGPGEPPVRAERLALRGQVQRALGETGIARQRFDEALALDPQQREALIGNAHLALAEGDLASARDWAERATAADDESAAAWELLAEIEFTNGDYDAAERALIRAELSARTTWMPRFKRALVRIERGDLAAAVEDIARVAAAVPNFAGLLYARGALALREGDTAAGIAALNAYLALDPDNARVLYLLGVAEYAQGNQEVAEGLLTRFTRAVPGSMQGALALSRVLVARNALAGAERVLRPLVPAVASATSAPAAAPQPDPASPTAALPATSQPPPDQPTGRLAAAARAAPPVTRPEVLAALAEVVILRGRHDEGQQLLERALALAPEHAGYRLASAQNLRALGRADAALAELDLAAEHDPLNRSVPLLRVKLLLERGQFDAALTSAAALAALHPRDPLAQNALGLARIGVDDIAGARAAFQLALDAQPGFADAALNLARLSLREQDIGAAQGWLEALLQAQPGHPEAILALAELDAAIGQRDAQVARLLQALAVQPQSLPLRLALIQALIADGASARAVTVAQSAPGPQQQDPALLLLRGQAELTIAAVREAIATYQTLVGLRPDAAAGHYLLARAYAQDDQLVPMRESLLRAIELDPGDALAPATMDLVFDRIADHAERRRYMERLLRAGRDDPRLIARQADLLVDAGDHAGAVALIEGLLARHPEDVGVLAKLVEVQRAAGQTGAAMATLETWLAIDPDAAAARMLLAEMHVGRDDEAQALALLEPLAEQQPSNALLLNNVAWLLREQAPERALGLAERAHRLQPQDPLVMDTLGSLLLEQGRTARALALLDQAYVAAPANPTIAYHYVRALVASGRASEARLILLGLVERPFAEQAAARRLLDELGG